MYKGIYCPKSVVGHLSPNWKSQVSKQSTTIVGETALMQTNLLWAFPSSDKLVEILLGKVFILVGPYCFETANLPPHSKNLEDILQ